MFSDEFISQNLDYLAWGFKDYNDTYGVKLYNLDADFLWCSIKGKYCSLIKEV